MEILAARLISWDMAHRLGDGYTSKCRHLHGHRYVAEIAIASPDLDRYGMVLDFAEIREVCDQWIQAHLDHACLVQASDHSLLEFLRREQSRHHVVEFNTTAERIAVWLAAVLQAELDRRPSLAARQVELVRLRLYETPNCYAEWSKR
jgi:6-pyruvoyltetrahydropterin/6-carboxytetrahydropterin synthase